MKSFKVITFACIVSLVCGAPSQSQEEKNTDQLFVQKQKFVLNVLQNVHQDNVLLPKYRQYKDYKMTDNLDKYSKPEKVKEFMVMHKTSPVPMGVIFTLFNPTHLSYVKALIEVFMAANDFDTIYKTAFWARFNVNKEVFVYAFSIAVDHRDEFLNIGLPAIYEVLPYYFFNSETIQRAQQYKMQGFDGVKKIEDVFNVVIPSNYTGNYGFVNDENLVSYFTEDIGVNEFYHNYNMAFPFWSSGVSEDSFFRDRRGGLYFWVHQQLLARFYMERLSNNLPDVKEFDFYSENFPGFSAGLRYYSGVNFPDRDNNYGFDHSGNHKNIDLVYLYAQRIYNAIDYKNAFLSNGEKCPLKEVKFFLETLGNMVQGNEDSVNEQVYGSLDRLFRDIVNKGFPGGMNGDEVPGAMYHYQTSIRDPAFFQIYKYLLRFYWHFTDSLPSYTRNELEFDGVKVTDVEMDKLVTYFDKFDADITNAVDVEPFNENKGTELYKSGRTANYQGSDYVIKARQYRLNHKPFTFKLKVSSTKDQKAMIKVMIGPKYDFYGKKIDINTNRKNFYQLDHFTVDLVEGENVIIRSSKDYSWFINDRTTYYDLYQKVFQSSGNEIFPQEIFEGILGFPDRLMLPKGQKGGMPFQFFFFVFPYYRPQADTATPYDPTTTCLSSKDLQKPEVFLAFPYDRKVDEKNWYLDNMYYLDTVIYHKSEVDINAVNN